jgi:hypothetical protein
LMLSCNCLAETQSAAMVTAELAAHSGVGYQGGQ